MKIIVTEGLAAIVNDGLRCAAKRAGDPGRRCNKLLAKTNSSGEVAGRFKCDRCKQDVEVELCQITLSGHVSA